MTTQSTVGALHRIIQWVESDGPAKSVDRLRIKILPVLLGENLSMSSIDAGTDASAACVAKVRQAATDIVGKPCPH